MEEKGSLEWRKGEQIGEGAFSKVYLYYSTNYARKYACKVSEDIENARKLSKEAEILKSLRHPIFPKYERFFTENGHACLLMEYIEGETLAKFMRRNGVMEQAVALRVARELAEGLCYLHELPESLIYRDLKPENIMIDSNGQTRIIDLGCACTVEQACKSKAGSRGYAAKEQLEAQNAGYYSDVYAWGRLTHYLLTGDEPCKPPYKKYPLRAYGKQFSPVLEKLLRECTAENFSERPPSMRNIIRVLDEIECGGRKYGEIQQRIFLRNRMRFRGRELRILFQNLFQRDGRDYCFIKYVCR